MKTVALQFIVRASIGLVLAGFVCISSVWAQSFPHVPRVSLNGEAVPQAGQWQPLSTTPKTAPQVTAPAILPPSPPQTRPTNNTNRKPFRLSKISRAEYEELEKAGYSEGFIDRTNPIPIGITPAPLGVTHTQVEVHGPLRLPANGPKDEYLLDGGDRKHRAYVGDDWKVHGLDVEDTIGHFDTLDGRRISAPSNQAAIYAPRFASVRRIAGVTKGSMTAQARSVEERTQTAIEQFDDLTAMTGQNLQASRNKTTLAPSAFADRTRGVNNESVTRASSFNRGFGAYENLKFLKWGSFDKNEGARLNLGIQGAIRWTDNLRVLIDNEYANIGMVEEVTAAQGLVVSETEGANPTLRVTKVASRLTAKSGDIVEFTIRFDNVGGQLIGNVTILDSLTPRLEYVPDSAESELDATFSSSRNEVDSLVLRWEIEEPLGIGKGGLIRFKCRVR